MSLKTVHIAFVTAAILLAVGFGWWNVKHSENMWGIGSFTAGGVLIYYLFWFLGKIKKINGAL